MVSFTINLEVMSKVGAQRNPDKIYLFKVTIETLEKGVKYVKS